MAQGARPQTSVPIAAKLIAQFGDATVAAKAARKEVRELQKEIKKTLQSGKTVGADVKRRLDQAMKLESDLNATIAKQKKAEAGVEAATAAANSMRYFLGAQGLRQILSGGAVDPRAISQLVFGAGEPIQDFARRQFGAKSGAFKIARAFAVIAPVVGEAVASVMEAVNQVKNDVKALKVFAADVNAGRIRQDEDALFRRLLDKNQHVFGKDPALEFRQIQSLTQKIAQLDEKGRAKALNPALQREMQDARETSIAGMLDPVSQFDNLQLLQKLTKKNLELGFANAFAAREKELGLDKAGTRLSEEQKSIVRQEVLLPIIAGLSETQQKELAARLDVELATLGQVFENKFKNLAQRRREASDKFKEMDVQKRQEIVFQQSRHRVKLNGRIGA